MAFTTQPIVVGGTYDFTHYVEKDGAVWDISGATVLIYFTKPDLTALAPLTATVSDGPAGVAHYANPTTLLDVPGGWLRRWEVSKGGIVLPSGPIFFDVTAAS